MNSTTPGSDSFLKSYAESSPLLRVAFPSTGEPLAADRYQSLSGLLGILRHRWKLAAFTALTVFALGAGAYFFIAAYETTTILEVNKDDPTDNDGAQSNGPVFNSDDIKDEIQTDVSILQTDDSLALEVVRKLDLLKQPSFRKAIDASEKNLPLDRAPRTRDQVLSLFHSHLKVDSPAESRLITISYKSHDPVLSARITNAMAQTFIEDTLSRRKLSILTSSEWLQHELDELKQKVQDSQQRLADYERNTGLAGIELTGTANANGNTAVTVTPQNTVTARLLTLNQELTAAEANRVSAEVVDHLIRTNSPDNVLGLSQMAIAGSNGASSAVTPESVNLLTQLRAGETDLRRQLSAVSIKYGENNPRRQELQSQIDMLDQQINAELGRMRERSANAYSYAKLNEDSIRQQFQQQEEAANDMADKSVKLQLLAQEAFSNQALYDNLFSKLQTATLASGTRATRIEIVAEAIPPGAPNFPKFVVYVAAVLAAGIFFGVTLAFVRENMDSTVRSLRDVPEINGLLFPGYIPRARKRIGAGDSAGGSELIDAPSSPFSEAFRALRTSISLAVPGAGPHKVLITSALGGSGKTTVTYNLGVAYAQQGSRVLLIDCDLRNPELHRLFSARLTPGLREACSLTDASAEVHLAQHATLPSLFLLPAGERPQLPSELFASSSFESLLRRVSNSFDYVLLDSPPLLSVTDASLIAGKVEAVVAVVRSRNTTRIAVSALAQALHRVHAPVLGFLLNDVHNPGLDGFHEYSYSRGKEDQLAVSA